MPKRVKLKARIETPRQTIRKRYTWYFREPDFDHSHWWEGIEHIDPVAALYELARRHPKVAELEYFPIPIPGEMVLPLPPEFIPSPFLQCTRRLAMKSWPKVTKSEQDEWKSSLGKIKSFDSRPNETVCCNITSLAESEIQNQHHDKSSPFTDYYCHLLEPTSDEWEPAIAHAAIKAHHQGHVIIAVASDLSPEKAEAAMIREYRNYKSQLRQKAQDQQQLDSILYAPIPVLARNSKTNQRERSEQWFPIIADFENAQETHPKGESQIFARYHRVLDGIPFKWSEADLMPKRDKAIKKTSVEGYYGL